MNKESGNNANNAKIFVLNKFYGFNRHIDKDLFFDDEFDKIGSSEHPFEKFIREEFKKPHFKFDKKKI